MDITLNHVMFLIVHYFHLSLYFIDSFMNKIVILCKEDFCHNKTQCHTSQPSFSDGGLKWASQIKFLGFLLIIQECHHCDR